MLQSKPRDVVLILSILFLCCPCIKAQHAVKRSEDALDGPVKTVRGEHRKIQYRDDKWVVGERFLSYVESYGTNGVPIERTSYKEDGSIDYEWTASNEKGGYMGCSTCQGKTEFRTSTEYDSKQRAAKEFDKTLEGLLIGWREYKYDDLDNMIEERRFGGTTLLSTAIYTYDERGRKATTEQLHSDGKLDRGWTYRYDINGNLVEEVVYNSGGSILSKLTFQYDPQGSVIEEDRYDGGQLLSTRTEYVYIYDLNGNWTERQTYLTSWFTTVEPPGNSFPRTVTQIQYRSITYY